MISNDEVARLDQRLARQSLGPVDVISNQAVSAVLSCVRSITTALPPGSTRSAADSPPAFLRSRLPGCTLRSQDRASLGRRSGKNSRGLPPTDGFERAGALPALRSSPHRTEAPFRVVRRMKTDHHGNGDRLARDQLSMQ